MVYHGVSRLSAEGSPIFRVLRFARWLPVLALAACSLTDAGPDAPPGAGSDAHAGAETPAAAPSDGAGVAYAVAFDGATEVGLEETMRTASQLLALANKPPSTLAALRRRADADVQRMTDVLRSAGYYGGSVSAKTEPADDGARVILTVRPGALYLIGDVAVDYAGTPPPAAVRPEIEDLGVVLGMTAEAERVVAAERRLERHFTTIGYPKADVARRRVTVNHDTGLMTVALTLATGPYVTMGDTRFEGADTVRERYLRALIPWAVDDPYDADAVEAYRRTLRESGLFASVAATVETNGADSGETVRRAPVAVSVTEAAHRSIGAGAKYSTSEGPGLKAFWEHRNLFGESETLRLTGQGGLIEQAFIADLRKPNFVVRDQDFVLLGELEREETDAYDALGITGRMGLERRSGGIWTTGLSATAELSEVTDDGDETISKLFGAPVFVRRDTTDSALDPTTGTRLGLTATPYIGHGETPLLFGVFEASASAYHALDDDGDVVLAARTRLGSLVGEDRSDVPADKRFYAGGGGSVRGYAFQEAGRLEPDADPEGGLSVLEVGAEARFRVTETIGVVPFIDGGAAQRDVTPTSVDDILWAGGLGLRYYTPIGPARLDVAVPFERRGDVDAPFQIYVSIGQAF
jgi:translocation and assembly module TamA